MSRFDPTQMYMMCHRFDPTQISMMCPRFDPTQMSEWEQFRKDTMGNSGISTSVRDRVNYNIFPRGGHSRISPTIALLR